MPVNDQWNDFFTRYPAFAREYKHQLLARNLLLLAIGLGIGAAALTVVAVSLGTAHPHAVVHAIPATTQAQNNQYVAPNPTEHVETQSPDDQGQ